MKKSQFERDPLDIENRLLNNLLDEDRRKGLPNLTQAEIDSFYKYQEQRAALAYQAHKASLNGLLGPEAQADAEALEKSGNAPKDPNKKNKTGKNKTKTGKLPATIDPTKPLTAGQPLVPGSRPGIRIEPTVGDPSTGTKSTSSGAVRNPDFIDKPDTKGTPAGSKPKAAVDPSKLTGDRLKIPKAVISNGILKPLAVIGSSKWLGPALLAGQGAKFVADWYAYNTGAARVQQLGDYTAPCLDSNYDPYDDPFIDIYSDDKGKAYRLNYYGQNFMDVLNTFGVEAFTPRMSNIVYGIIPTLLTSAATSLIIFRAFATIAAAAGAATGPGVIIGAIAGLISIGVGWIISIAINKLLKTFDKWGPGTSDFVAQFIMEQITTSSSRQQLCSADLAEAAQGDEYQDRDEEPIRGGGVDTFAIMELAATIKEVFKEIDQELQAEGDQEKLAEWRRTLKKAKQMAVEDIKG